MTALDEATQVRHLRLAAELAGIPLRSDRLPQSRKAVVGPLRLHYLDWGRPAGGAPAIVFLHGGALNAHTWDVVCLGLRDRFHCLALDLRGHGDSDWSPEIDYSATALAGDLDEFIDRLGLTCVVLVGHSLGGIAAMEFASRQHLRVAGLVLVDVGPEMRPEGTRRILEFLAEGAELPSPEHFVQRALRFNRRRHPDLLRASILHNLKQLPNGAWTWKYDRRHFGAVDPSESDRATRALAGRLPHISCPVLVMRGERSDVFSSEDAAWVIQRVADGRSTTVPDAGHTIQGDNPQAFVAVLLTFLTEVRSRERSDGGAEARDACTPRGGDMR